MIIRTAEYENIIEYISHNLIRTLYNDIKHVVAKHRPIIPLSTKDCFTMIRFPTPRMSEKEVSLLFDKHYDEIKKSDLYLNFKTNNTSFTRCVVYYYI